MLATGEIGAKKKERQRAIKELTPEHKDGLNLITYHATIPSREYKKIPTGA